MCSKKLLLLYTTEAANDKSDTSKANKLTHALCLLQARAWISDSTCNGHFSVQRFKVFTITV
jgi:hypothetical protein